MVAIGVLAVGLAHDFNNLLTVISLNRGAAEVAEGDAAAPFMQTARNALESAARLAQQMLSIGNRTDATRHTIQIRPEIDAIVDLLRRNTGPDIDVTVDVADDLYLVASPIQLQHVVLNLLSNAAGAMPDGGQMAIRASVPSGAAPAELVSRELGYVAIEVTDDGPGMPPEPLIASSSPTSPRSQRADMGSGWRWSTGSSRSITGRLLSPASLERGRRSRSGSRPPRSKTRRHPREVRQLATARPTPPRGSWRHSRLTTSCHRSQQQMLQRWPAARCSSSTTARICARSAA